MRGAQEIVAARLRGFAPPMVFVDLDLPGVPLTGDSLLIEENDRLSSLDLRCIHGLVVSVSGVSAGKTHAVANACVEAGASRVITSISDGHKVIEVTDTEGVLTWRQ